MSHFSIAARRATRRGLGGGSEALDGPGGAGPGEKTKIRLCEQRTASRAFLRTMSPDSSSYEMAPVSFTSDRDHGVRPRRGRRPLGRREALQLLLASLGTSASLSKDLSLLRSLDLSVSKFPGGRLDPRSFAAQRQDIDQSPGVRRVSAQVHARSVRQVGRNPRCMHGLRSICKLRIRKLKIMSLNLSGKLPKDLEMDTP